MYLAKRKAGSILAVDADPNSTLAEALGVGPTASIASVVEDTVGKTDTIPAGMTKERFIDMRIQEALAEGGDFDLLVMGRPEGPGCYCYINNLLRSLTAKIMKNYDFVVIDNAAGMEHISRKTAGSVNKMVFVSDYSMIGIRSAKKIYELAKDIGIKMQECFLIINKASGDIGAFSGEIRAAGLKLAGAVGFSKQIESLSVEKGSLAGMDSDIIEEVAYNVIGNSKRELRGAGKHG